ncbi:hypothetical protein PCE1_000575 [Barthelona sp. PCE]
MRFFSRIIDGFRGAMQKKDPKIHSNISNFQRPSPNRPKRTVRNETAKFVSKYGDNLFYSPAYKGQRISEVKAKHVNQSSVSPLRFSMLETPAAVHRKSPAGITTDRFNFITETPKRTPNSSYKHRRRRKQIDDVLMSSSLVLSQMRDIRERSRKTRTMYSLPSEFDSIDTSQLLNLNDRCPLGRVAGQAVFGKTLKSLLSGGWLDDSAMNVCMSMIGEFATENVVVLSTFLSAALSAANYDTAHRLCRKQPLFCSSQTVLIPFHVDGNHWIMIAICFRSRCVYLYDSLAKYPGSTEKVSLADRNQLKTISSKTITLLSLLFRFLKSEAQHRRKIFEPQLFNVCLPGKLAPQQNNLDDCGVFALMIAEFHSKSSQRFPFVSFPFTYSHIPDVRKRYALQIVSKKELLSGISFTPFFSIDFASIHIRNHEYIQSLYRQDDSSDDDIIIVRKV